jgi:glycosyltransferase involved in cell wall biosynthesis
VPELEYPLIQGDLLRLAYISTAIVPSPAAHARQIVSMCQAFNALPGVHVTLYARPAVGIDSPHEWRRAIETQYGAIGPVDLVDVGGGEHSDSSRAFRVARRIISAMNIKNRLAHSRHTILYTRDPYLLAFAVPKGAAVIVEEHQPPVRFFDDWLRRRAVSNGRIRGVVYITDALRNRYIEHGVYRDQAQIVAPDGCSIREIRQGYARKSKHTPSGRIERPRVGYVGRLHGGRGIRLIFEMARRRPNVTFEIIGALGQDQSLIASRPKNCMVRGYLTSAELAGAFDELDIVLMPYERNTQTSGGMVSTAWMSPMKMFEYLASGIPCIASDLPVLKEVLQGGKNCLLAKPGAVDEWIKCVDRLAADGELRRRLTASALQDAESYRWDRRAARILSALEVGTMSPAW